MAYQMQGRTKGGETVPISIDEAGRVAVAIYDIDDNGNLVETGDREVLPTRYTVKQAYTGAAVGDVVLKNQRQTMEIDLSTSPLDISFAIGELAASDYITLDSFEVLTLTNTVT